jgi:hypothetical protein
MWKHSKGIMPRNRSIFYYRSEGPTTGLQDCHMENIWHDAWTYDMKYTWDGNNTYVFKRTERHPSERGKKRWWDGIYPMSHHPGSVGHVCTYCMCVCTYPCMRVQMYECMHICIEVRRNAILPKEEKNDDVFFCRFSTNWHRRLRRDSQHLPPFQLA